MNLQKFAASFDTFDEFGRVSEIEDGCAIYVLGATESDTLPTKRGSTDPFWPHVHDASPFSHSYDADGNLVSDGTRTFAWSASGRLTEAASATTGRRYVSAYDHLGRRIRRTEYRRIGRPWVQVEDREYVYDGWNLVHETRTASGVETDIEYFWGPDLSGSLQGAGGVGGLVAVSVDGSFYFPGYDNNGNVIGYWNEDGDIVAEYAYDAFGNMIYEDGDMADFFPHRFSTKYYDAETDLYYYGYRYYSPSLGRWISRDPKEEKGGHNLFVACNNQHLFRIDGLGLQGIVFIKGNNSGEPVNSVDDIPWD